MVELKRQGEGFKYGGVDYEKVIGVARLKRQKWQRWRDKVVTRLSVVVIGGMYGGIKRQVEGSKYAEVDYEKVAAMVELKDRLRVLNMVKLIIVKSKALGVYQIV